jgi:hypothetical protein
MRDSIHMGQGKVEANPEELKAVISAAQRKMEDGQDLSTIISAGQE